MSDSDSGMSFVAGLVFGTLIGGVLGVLLAPQSGADTRQQIKEETIGLGDKARERAQEQRELPESKRRLQCERHGGLHELLRAGSPNKVAAGRTGPAAYRAVPPRPA